MEVAVDGWRACSHSPRRQPGCTLHGVGCGVHLLLSEESLVLSCGHKGMLHHHALLLLNLVTVVSELYVAFLRCNLHCPNVSTLHRAVLQQASRCM